MIRINKKTSRFFWFFASGCFILAALLAIFSPTPLFSLSFLSTSLLLFLRGRQKMGKNKAQFDDVGNKMRQGSVFIVVITSVIIMFSIIC